MFVIGLDLGQKQDYSAVAVVEREERKLDPKPMLYLRHLERYPLGMLYGDQMDLVAGLVRRVKREINHIDPEPGVHYQLIVDATGVGVGVIEMLKDRDLKYKAVSITGGMAENVGSGGVYHVPKRELVARAVAPFESKRLKIPRTLPLVRELKRELENFKVKVNPRTAHDSYEAWRETDHDDLVLALSLACWWCERRRPLRAVPMRESVPMR